MCSIYTCASGCAAPPAAIVPWLHPSPFPLKKEILLRWGGQGGEEPGSRSGTAQRDKRDRELSPRSPGLRRESTGSPGCWR